MKYRIMMHVDVDARDDREALEWAKKIEESLRHPMLRMSLESDGIRLYGGDGRPVVYAPTREVA